MKLQDLAELLDRKCQPTCTVSDELTVTQLQRVQLYRAKIDNERWPHNSLKAHRYALRQMRRLEPLSSNYERCEVYDSIVSQYVNRSSSWM